METISKYLSRSFVFSSLLPTTLFTLIISIIFHELPVKLLLTSIKEISNLSIGELFFPIILTLWLAYFVFDNKDIVVRIFEGFFFPRFIRDYLSRLQVKRIKKITRSYQEFTNFQTRLEEKVEKRGWITEEENEIAAKNYFKAYEELSIPETIIPEEAVLPTRLGNILRAAEMYPYERYGMDGITLWSKLFKTLPKEFQEEIETAYDELLFLLNSVIYGLNCWSSAFRSSSLLCVIQDA
jgi:hypothetical protein